MSLSTYDQPIDNVCGVPPPEHTHNKVTTESQKPDLTCTTDPIKKKAQSQVVGVENAGGQHIAKQLDCTTIIPSTQNNGIHRIYCGQHTTLNSCNHLAVKWKCELIIIWGMDWTTSKSYHANEWMLWRSCSLNLISGLAMIVGLEIIHMSSEHCTTGILPNIYSSRRQISRFRHTMILNLCAWHPRNATESSVG